MKKQKKVSEYGLNQINKGVLLLIPKLITVGEEIPTPNDIIGYSHNAISGRSPQNNKLKYQLELIHVCKQCQQKWWNLIHVGVATVFTVLLSLKLKNYKGIPLLGGPGEYPPLRGGKNTLQGRHRW